MDKFLDKSLHTVLNLNDSVRIPGLGDSGSNQSGNQSTDDTITSEYDFSNSSFNAESLKRCLQIRGMEHENHTEKLFEDLNEFKYGFMIEKVTSKGKKQSKKLVFDLSKSIIVCANKKVSFSEIDEIRVGHLTNIFNLFKSKEKTHAVVHDQSFSIIYSSTKSVDFICTSVEQRRKIVSGLSHVVNQSKQMDNEVSFIRREWNKFEKNALGLNDLRKLLANLNYSAPTDTLTALISAVDKNQDHELNFMEFSDLFKLLRSRTEIKAMLLKYSSPSTEYLTIPQLQKFFASELYETWSVDKCKELIENIYHEQLDRVEFEKLEEYIVSEKNNVLDPKTEKMYQPTDRPITHYYMNSSHNTYLAGHQLQGQSSTEMYTSAFRSGCRCVELDVWDGADGDPIIFHGRTLTSQIKFSHVLEAVKNHGFETTPYPVVLSLETHCTIPQQKKMADHLINILGDMLPKAYTTDDEGKVQQLPTLEELKYKVLIKGYAKARPVTSQSEMAAILKEDEEEEIEDLTKSGTTKKDSKKPPKEKVADELSDIIYLKTESFKSAEKTMTIPPWVMHSFSESKVLSILSNEDPYSIIKLNYNHFVRVYPKGTRFGSSNYDPVPGWTTGCQIVALNHQTSSLPMWLNRGMFTDNGNVGYVLKPECILPNDTTTFDPTSCERHPTSRYSKLIVEVMSGRQLPKYGSSATKGEVIDPFVTVTMHGCKVDQSEYKTKVVDNNGFNPHWGETFEFPLVHDQFAMLSIRVDDKDKFNRQNRIGHFCIRISNIRPGLRIVRLRNDNGDIIPLCNVLCKFTFVEKEQQ